MLVILQTSKQQCYARLLLALDYFLLLYLFIYLQVHTVFAYFVVYVLFSVGQQLENGLFAAFGQ